MPVKTSSIQLAKKPVAFKPLSIETVIARMNIACAKISQRAYEIFENNGHIFGHELDHWLQAEKELLHPVHLEMYERDETFHVKAEVPGYTEKELEVCVEPRRLVITGKHDAGKEEKKGKKIYSEICWINSFASLICLLKWKQKSSRHPRRTVLSN